MPYLRRLHSIFLAYLVKWLRTRYVLKQFKIAHAQEIVKTPVQFLPVTMARQDAELRAIRAGNLNIHGGNPADETDRKSWQWPFLPSCLDEATDILTRRGFVPVAEMVEGDVFATRDPDGRFEWQRATALTKQRYAGEMCRFEGIQLDQLVTPNHRMLAKSHRLEWQGRVRKIVQSVEFIRRASKLVRDVARGAGDRICIGRKRYYIPLTAKPDVCTRSVPEYVDLIPVKRNRQDRTSKSLRIETDTWIKFLALYLADGSCEGTTEGIVWGEENKPYEQHASLFRELLREFRTDPFAICMRHPGSKYRVRISCKDTSEIRGEVAELLAQIPVAWTPSDQGFQCGSKALWFALFPFGNSYTKRVPKWIRRLPVDKLQLFWSWLLKSDGHSSISDDSSGEYSSASPQFTEDVCSILVQLGYGISTDSKPQTSGASANRVRFFSKEYCRIRKVSIEAYDGYVYCPTVPNGIVCVRRNGKISWTGNSVRRLQVPIAKLTPYNLRRMSRTPVPRRAMNMIKGAMISLTWDVRQIEGVETKDKQGQLERIKIAKKMFKHPNSDDSFQSFLEQGLEDYLILGGFVSELGLTVDPQRPLKMWPVNVESIRLMPAWQESTPDMPRYVQMTGLKGERGALAFYDDEMMYLKDNPSTDNPFGLGCMEVAFQSVNDFLGVQGMSGRAGTDQVHKTWLWWEAAPSEATIQIVRRHIQNDLEGQAKISLLGGAKKPEVLEVQPVVIEDLLIPWQEMLIRMIANAFQMSAMALGIEHDINRAVGQVLSDKDFRTAVVPTAKRIQEGFTRRILHNKLHWDDLEFVFTNLDDPDLETMMDMLAKLYSMNAMTPNRALKKLNMEKLPGPFGDMTQSEQMIALMRAQSLNQNDLAKQNMQRQQDAFDQMQPPYPPSPGADGADGQQPGQQKLLAPATGAQPGTGGGGGSGLKVPKPMVLPKFPIQGVAATAKQVARMPVNQVQDVFYNSGFKPSRLVKAMDDQEPGILQQLADEVKDFIHQQLVEEQKSGMSKVSPAQWTKWEKELKKAVRKDNKRTNDLSEWMRKSGGTTLGRPGTSSGRPGTSGPTRT